MCGFVGLRRFDGRPVDGRHLAELACLIQHRGPDGADVWTSGPAGLAHRRLAIIDPTGSPQPMVSPDGRTQLVFNGEILNYRELRRGLPGPFRTQGDTEVLLKLHRQRGIDAVRELRGQFAYAVHDSALGETWLVRDRLGILPLFYVADGDRIAFASEIKALLPLLDRIEVDEAQLDAYLLRRSVPAPATLIKGVHKLPPGCYAHIDPTGRLRVERYWSPDEVPDRRVGPQQAVRLVADALDSAVDANLVADVPVGSYLSGGLDSSLIAALAAGRSEPGSLHTFSAGFGDERYDELPHARLVAATLGTNHHEVVVGPNDFEALWSPLTWHRDAPMSEPADVAVHALARAASEHVKVVLSGEGADEVFAGYPKHRLAALSELPVPGPVRWGMRRIERSMPAGLARARQGVRALSEPTPAARREGWFAPFNGPERAALLGRPVSADPVCARGGAGSPLRRMLTADCGAWLSDNLLERGDRMTMAASMELRPPFLDHRVVELGLSLPDNVKVRRGTGKWVVRQVASHHLPRSIIERPKVGFKVPLDSWFRQGLRDFARDTLLAGDAFVGEVFDRSTIAGLLERHEGRRHDENIRIWTLLSLEIWHQVSVRSAVPIPAEDGGR